MGDRPNQRTSGTNRDAGGVALLCLSALAFSTAGLFTRLAPVALGPMVFWRNVFGCAGLALVLLVRRGETVRALGSAPRRCLGAIGCSAFATICYLAAFASTTVADIAIIYATAPLLTAALAWFILGERPVPRTLLAAVAALVGVVVTVAGSVSRGSLVGDGLAFLMTLALSGVAILARGAALPPLTTAFGASLLAAAAVLPSVALGRVVLAIDGFDAMWLALFGLVTMTLALPAYLAGAARVPAGRTMLISAIELPFAPLWVWIVFGEVPARTSLLGGGIVLLAVLSDLRSRGQ